MFLDMMVCVRGVYDNVVCTRFAMPSFARASGFFTHVARDGIHASCILNKRHASLYAIESEFTAMNNEIRVVYIALVHDIYFVICSDGVRVSW